jgi:hypothetical protein
MNGHLPDENRRAQLRMVAAAFPYPPTPDIVGRVRRQLTPVGAQRGWGARPTRRGAGVALALALLVAGFLATPAAQAVVRAIFRIGAVEVVLTTPTPAPTAQPGTLPATAILSPAITAEPGMTPPANAPATLQYLTGETTLDTARGLVSFPIRLPGTPPDLGPPGRVFVQNLGGEAVILAWPVAGQPDQPRLALYELHSTDPMLMKQANNVQTTHIHGQVALWVAGPHTVEFLDALGRERLAHRRLVGGNALIWEETGITYRLESGLDLDAATRIAESLR